jgi:acetyltransferase-like isoleucine patch superfamily enzyme
MGHFRHKYIYKHLYFLFEKIKRVLVDSQGSAYRAYPGIHKSVIFSAAYSGFVTLVKPEKIQIGEGSVVNPDSVIDGTGTVKIGRFCHFARGLTIYSSNHNYKSKEYIPYGKDDVLMPVVIEDFVWIGANVSIVPGVTIGEGAVIGMGSVVVSNVEPLKIYAGNPARQVGERDKGVFQKLKELKRYI